MKKAILLIFFFVICLFLPIVLAVETCSDSDTGADYFVVGTVTGFEAGSPTSATDFCEGAILREFSCGENPQGNRWNYTWEDYNCPYGCYAGRCNSVPQLSCSDSDTGADYFVVGTVTGFEAGSPTSVTDFCEGNVLREYSCGENPLGNRWNYTWDDFTCANGCTDGACTEGEVVSSCVGINAELENKTYSESDELIVNLSCATPNAVTAELNVYLTNTNVSTGVKNPRIFVKKYTNVNWPIEIKINLSEYSDFLEASGEYSVAVCSEDCTDVYPLGSSSVTMFNFEKSGQLAGKYFTKDCLVENGVGTCEFLGVTYNVTHKGCNDSVELLISGVGWGDSFIAPQTTTKLLRDGTLVRINGAPCMAPVVNLGFMKKTIESITSDGSYLVMNNAKINLNNLEITVEDVSYALSGDTDPKITLTSNNSQMCVLKVGNECKFFYGAVSHPLSKNVYVKVEAIYPVEGNSAALIKVEKIDEAIPQIVPTIETGPIEIPVTTTSTPTVVTPQAVPSDTTPIDSYNYVCTGCELDSKCYPFGYRKDSSFCSDSQSFVAQQESDASCNNSFECQSNVCASDKCVSQDLFSAIINFFKNLFGMK